MKIDWEISGGVIVNIDLTKAMVLKRGEEYVVRIYDMSPGLTSGGMIEKSCNNLIEALHWAEDELKFHSGTRVGNA